MNKNIKILTATLLIPAILYGCVKATTAKAQTVNTQIVTTQSNQLETYFTKKDGNLDNILIKEINTAQKTLDIAIYSLTKEDIANAILEAKKRGVDVKVVTDKQESQSKYQKAILDKLKANGIPIKINSHAGLMHLKVSIIDSTTATGGSYNYTESATKNNDENLIIMRNSDIVGEYVAEYNAMWNDTNNYTNY